MFDHTHLSVRESKNEIRNIAGGHGGSEFEAHAAGGVCAGAWEFEGEGGVAVQCVQYHTAHFLQGCVRVSVCVCVCV